jgi:polysaccharide deacetylase family protein (PEP-CTERM system associated)
MDSRQNEPKAVMVTVDLEDWFQVENLRPLFPPGTWDSCELRVERNVHMLLELFDACHVEATFFVLGWVAERCRGLVREVARAGHEIASHGYSHRLCRDLTDTALRGDIEMSRSVLGDITGEVPAGYRAPNFSITKELTDILAELGFAYDSSYNSFGLNNRYGRAEGLRWGADGHLVADSGIVELPVSNLTVMGRTVPWAGGGYFRLWPMALFECGVARILQREGKYVFYCHPWEVDPEQPRQTSGIGWVSAFRHYLNLDRTLDRLKHFLFTFRENRFISCSRYLGVGLGKRPCEEHGPRHLREAAGSI